MSGPDQLAASAGLGEGPAARARAFVDRVAREVDPEATTKVVEDDDQIRVTVEGEDLAPLIGRHGATIDALQYLTVRAAYPGGSRGDDATGRATKAVVVDAAGYRDRREAQLRRAADAAVEDAVRRDGPVELEPMSAPERKVVHTYLKDRPGIETHSEGEEPDRRLVITPLLGEFGR